MKSNLNENQEMLEKLKEISKKEYVGDAGAGMVKVVIGSNFLISKVEIDHTIFAKTAPEIFNDLDFLADLFKAAANQATERANTDITQSYYDVSR